MLKDFTKEDFDVIIQAGQSNSQGIGMGAADQPFSPSDKIWFLNSDFTISKAAEEVWGNEIVNNFSMSFCREYIEKGRLQQGRKLLIVKSAVGGTGFLDKHWGPSDDLYLRMIEMTKTAVELNPKNKLIALIWHQGETDASLNASYETHYNNLTILINLVREQFGCKSLPFIAGDFVNQWKTDNIEICKPVVKAIRDVCGDIGYAKFVETDELLSNDQRFGNKDTIHFCREALNILGVKYFDAFCEIVDEA